MNTETIQRILAAAEAEGRSALLEPEVYQVLAAAGVRVPVHVLVKSGEPVSEGQLAALGGRRVVLKIVSPQIAHKTEVGGVRQVEATAEAVRLAVARMLEEVPRRLARLVEQGSGHAPAACRGLSGEALEASIRKELRGVLVVERVEAEGAGVGSEALFALRHNREFGPVITMGVGGIDAELLGEACRKGVAVASASTAAVDEAGLLAAFRPTLAYRRLAGLTRTGGRLVEDSAILELLGALRALGEAFGRDGPGEGWTFTELEVNPFAVRRGELVALDGLAQFRRRAALPAPRPLASLGPMLEPKSLAVIGVSAKGMNMGRLILNNILEAGFDRSRAYVIRPDVAEIDGVRCVARIADLPERVDLLVVAVAAEQVAPIMEDLAEHDRAVGVILIPGGMAEKAGGEAHEARVKAAITRARELGRPLVVNGGNCLGIVSRPGRYHTLFIPRNKLALREDGRSNVALISQSGAYMISRLSKLDWLNPRYAVSTGNQVDLTLSDFLRRLSEDREVTCFGVYVEGFKDGDGLAFARAVREVVASGRDVVFYKAGRTAEGQVATSGHTASLAGDYQVCEAVVAQAGAMVARDFEEFLDLLKVSALLGGKRWSGRRLSALSNAGYEAVGIADGVRGEGWRLELARHGSATRARLQAALVQGRVDGLVDVRNPLDLTPMADDRAHEEVVRAFLDDPETDLVLCATIPLTPAMATLDRGVPEAESIRSEGSLVNRLARVLGETDKPLVVSIDSGPVFDPMARAFEEKGLPCFRSADRAVRAMGLYAAAKGL